MEKSSQIAWKIVPLRHFFPLKVVPLIEVLLYTEKSVGWYEQDMYDRQRLSWGSASLAPLPGFPKQGVTFKLVSESLERPVIKRNISRPPWKGDF
jgi:hypothetical protein